MKRIEAFVQPFMLHHVVRELRAVGAHGLTVHEVRGFGREKDESFPHHASDFAVEFTPKVKLEILCRDQEVDGLVGAVVKAAHTGRRGDGKVFVTAIEHVVSVRSGEQGEPAI